jgi:hypothetical protein
MFMPIIDSFLGHPVPFPGIPVMFLSGIVPFIGHIPVPFMPGICVWLPGDIMPEALPFISRGVPDGMPLGLAVTVACEEPVLPELVHPSASMDAHAIIITKTTIIGLCIVFTLGRIAS